MAENVPEVSEKDRKLLDDVERRAHESQVWRDTLIDGVHTLRDLWSLGPRRFHGDHWGSTPHNVGVEIQEGLKYSTINRTQASMVSTIAVMTERPMRIALQPVETADEGLYFVLPKTGRAIARQMRGATVEVNLQAMFEFAGVQPPSSEQISGIKPLSPDQYEVLAELPLITATGEPGMAPYFSEEDFIELDDTTAGKAFQIVFDKMYDAACGEPAMAEHALYFSTVGTQFALVQWDFDKRCPKFINMDVMNVRPDPVHTRIEDMDYLILDQVMTADDAKKEYPKAAQKIDWASQEGRMETATDEREIAGRYGRTEFGRKMVVVRTMWERGHDYPLADPNDTADPHHREGVDKGWFIRGPEGYEPNPDEDVPKTVKGIRQVVVLPQIDMKVEDQRCPYADIPVLHTVNVPIVGSPYGLGEPQRLEDIQQFINELATGLINRLRYYSYPQEYWPQSLLEAVERATDGTAPYSHPGRVIGIEDAQYRDFFIEGKRNGFVEEPPPLPNDLVGLMQLWFEVHDHMSGYVAVLQGRPPSADSSGVAIHELQQQARGPIGYKSGHLQESLRRLGMLLSDAIIKFLPEFDWTRYLSKYPPGVAMSFLDAIKSMRFDITAEIVSGRGVQKQSDQETAMQRRMMVPPTISQQSLLELVDDNPDQEQKRLEEEQAALMGAQGPEAPATPFDSAGNVPAQPQPA